jgi:hypothetical protein
VLCNCDYFPRTRCNTLRRKAPPRFSHWFPVGGYLSRSPGIRDAQFDSEKDSLCSLFVDPLAPVSLDWLGVHPVLTRGH